jgi:hypothetical protein
VNNGSTYSASYEAHVVLKGIGGCDMVSDAVGAGSGTIPGDDGVVASVYREDDGTWRMSIAAGGEVRTTSTETSCLGSSSGASTVGIRFPVCDGTEVAGSNHTKFKFNCGHTGDWTWSLTGTLTVQLP